VYVLQYRVRAGGQREWATLADPDRKRAERFDTVGAALVRESLFKEKDAAEGLDPNRYEYRVCKVVITESYVPVEAASAEARAPPR
jgi:hypothetical protein